MTLCMFLLVDNPLTFILKVPLQWAHQCYRAEQLLLAAVQGKEVGRVTWEGADYIA